MPENTQSADPQALARYADRSAEINDILRLSANRLENALEVFAARCTEWSSRASPELAGRVRSHMRNCELQANWVRRVGREFAETDAAGLKKYGLWLLPASFAMKSMELTTVAAALRKRLDLQQIRGARKKKSSLKDYLKAPKGTKFKIKINSKELRKYIGLGKNVTFEKGDWRSKRSKEMRSKQMRGLAKSAAKNALYPRTSSLSRTVMRDAGLRRWDASKSMVRVARGLWWTKLGVTGYQNFQRYQGETETDVRVAKTAAATTFDFAVSAAINVGATAAGTALGAGLGSFIGGPVGAAIGARVGGIAGSMAGAWISDKVMGSDVYKGARDGIANFVGGLFD